MNTFFPSSRLLRAACAGACAGVLALGPAPLFAQIGLPGLESSALLSLSPAHPGPGDTVRLTLGSSVLDLSGAAIEWTINGKTAAEAENALSLSLTAGPVGSETDVRADIATANGQRAGASAIVIPSEIDLLVDSDSYIPPFYRGAALPSAGVALILQAIPRMKRPGEAFAAPADLVYTWRRDGEVIESVSGKGRFSARIAAPHLFGAETISVEARSADGTLATERSVTVRSIQPVLMLYEDHPLYGIRYGQAFGRTAIIGESEATLAAIPYFAEAEDASDPRLSYTWRINDVPIKPAPGAPNKLTLGADGSSGTARIELNLTHRTNYYTDAQGAWDVTLARGEGGPSPFEAPAQ